VEIGTQRFGMHLRINVPNGKPIECIVTESVIRLGRDPGCEVPFDPQIFPSVSGMHAKIEKTESGFVITHLSRSNRTLVNDQPISGTVPVAVGDRIRLGFTGPIIDVLALEPRTPSAMAVESAPAQDIGKTMAAAPQHVAMLRGSRGANRMEIGKGGIIGREQDAAFVLDHPHISRRHARVTVEGDRVFLQDLGSANGTFVNGSRLTQRIKLEPVIDLCPADRTS
jgi:ABC transport system ATP-binding/permease protein